MASLAILGTILAELPNAIQTIEAVAVDLDGGQKKQALLDGFEGVAAGVVKAIPGESETATLALKLADSLTDSLVSMFNSLGVFKHKTKLPTPAGPIATPVMPAPSSPLMLAASTVRPGPGLHTVTNA